MAAECTMICLDNSYWPLHKESPSKIRDQVTAIEHYFNAKIQSNPENTLGIVATGVNTCITTGQESNRLLLLPTNGCSEMTWARIRRISQACGMDVVNALYMACNGFILSDSINLPRRIILFAGGDLTRSEYSLKKVGSCLKFGNVALDVVSIGDHEKWTTERLKTLVAAADNKGNSRIVHVPSTSAVCQAILSPPIFRDVRERTYMEEWPPLNGREDQ